MAIPLEGGKAAIGAGKALTGDIYTRRWRTKKGKKGPEVEHELRVNPVGLGLGAVAVGAAAVAGGVALWATQNRLAVDDVVSGVTIPVTFVEGTATKTLKADAPPKPLRADFPVGATGDMLFSLALSAWIAEAYEITYTKKPWCFWGLKTMDTEDFVGHEADLLAPKVKDPSVSAYAPLTTYSVAPIRTTIPITVSGVSTKMTIKQRRGFGLFSDGQPLDDLSDAAKELPVVALGGPIGLLISYLRR